MDLIMGLLFFIAVIVLTGLYIFIGWTGASLLRAGILLVQKKIEGISLGAIYPKYLMLALYLFFIVYNITFYMNMRSQWIWSKGNAHLEAKEYFVSGQVLYGFRKLLNQLGLHPESIVMAPLTSLQEVIYEQGKLHLPKDDAEASIWHYEWFIYPYSRRDLVPHSLKKDDLSEMQKLLDETWQDIENMMELQVADAGMKERSSELLPAAMIYYTGRDKHYKYGMYEKVPWRLGLAQEAGLVRRYKKIVKFAENVKQNDYKYGSKEITPSSFGALLVAKNDSLQRLIMADIYKQKFTCSSPYVEILYILKQEVSGQPNKESRLKVLWQKKYKEWNMYYSLIHESRGAIATQKILRDKCGVSIGSLSSSYRHSVEKLFTNTEYQKLYEMTPSGLVPLSFQKLQVEDKKVLDAYYAPIMGQ